MDIFEIQKQLIKDVENPIIFDVGAWFGDTAKNYLNVFGENITVYSFEPSKMSYDNMINVTKLPLNVKTFHIALGNEDKEIEFNINLEQQTNSILHTHPDAEKTWGCKACDYVRTEIVKMTTIDKFVEEHNIDRIDILKMDTQGTEYMVVEGAERMIRENKIKIIFTEMIIMPTYVGQKHLDELLYFYRKNGFILYNLYGNQNGQAKQMDGIFIHESYYEKIK
jgi:FkbM family methyltransferase